LWGLTFEVSWRQRQDARPKPQKMYTVPVAWAWWPAVGAQLDRGVRPHLAVDDRVLITLDAQIGLTVSAAEGAGAVLRRRVASQCGASRAASRGA
jgi:hypothetical protein